MDRFDTEQTNSLMDTFHLTIADLVFGDTLDNMILDAGIRLDTDVKSLRAKIVSCQNELARALERVDNNYSTNSLGILQGSALDLDRQSALVDANAASFRRLLYIRTEQHKEVAA